MHRGIQMMKKSVLIIEDCPEQRNMLRQLVLDVDERAAVYTAADVATSYKILM